MSQDLSTAGPNSTATTGQGNGLAVAGLVCGLVGLLLFPVILGPLGIIFGGIGWSRANHGAPHKGMSVAGVVLGIVDLVLWGVLLAVAAKHGGSFYVNVG